MDRSDWEVEMARQSWRIGLAAAGDRRVLRGGARGRARKECGIVEDRKLERAARSSSMRTREAFR
jgi:hypothetical protein